MKSLEIVNKLIEETDKSEDIHLYSFERVIDDNDLQQIKQDLEVLEILKDLFKKPSREYIGNDFGVMINGVELYMKNKEDFNKVKQWLEGNE